MNTIAMAIDAFMLTLPRYGLFYYNTRFVTLQAFLRGAREKIVQGSPARGLPLHHPYRVADGVCAVQSNLHPPCPQQFGIAPRQQYPREAQTCCLAHTLFGVNYRTYLARQSHLAEHYHVRWQWFILET